MTPDELYAEYAKKRLCKTLKLLKDFLHDPKTLQQLAATGHSVNWAEVHKMEQECLLRAIPPQFLRKNETSG